MKKIILAMMICLTVIMLFGCGGKYDKKYEYDGVSLIGKWIDKNVDESEYDIYNFVDESTVILSTNCYGIEKGRMKATYKVEDKNQIVIHSEFGYEYIRFSITDDGYLVLLVLDDMNNPSEEERIMKKYDLAYNTSKDALKDIVGTWINSENSAIKFTFNDDYTGTSVQGDGQGAGYSYKIYYSLKDSTLYFIFEYSIGLEDESRSCEYKVENDTLTLYGKDDKGNKTEIKFTREK